MAITAFENWYEMEQDHELRRLVSAISYPRLRFTFSMSLIQGIMAILVARTLTVLC